MTRSRGSAKIRAEILEFTAQEDFGRIDRFLAEVSEGISRSRIRQLIDGELVTVAGNPVRPSRKVATGETVRVEVPPPVPSVALAEELELEIIYEDKWLAAVAKPKGMVVHPAPGHSSGTLVNALLARLEGLSGIGGVMRPGIVHRLDKDTSGVVLVAKDDVTHRGLQALFKERRIDKTYLALVVGSMTGEGEIDTPIGRHPTDRKKMAAGVERGGRPALTRWSALASLEGCTLLQVKIETGRTHQIRAHFTSVGHPVVGDPLYGGISRARGIMDKRVRLILTGETSQALHAWKLGFAHPATGEAMQLEAPVPAEMVELIRSLGGDPKVHGLI